MDNFSHHPNIFENRFFMDCGYTCFQEDLVMEPIVSDRQQPVRPKNYYGKKSFTYMLSVVLLLCLGICVLMAIGPYIGVIANDISSDSFMLFIGIVLVVIGSYYLLLFGCYLLSIGYGLTSVFKKEKHWTGPMSLFICAIPICIAIYAIVQDSNRYGIFMR